MKTAIIETNHPAPSALVAPDFTLDNQALALQAFTADEGLKPMIDQARELVEGFEHDLSTKAGRQRTASLARKVATLKTTLDGLGKDLVSGWKAKAKVVDQARRDMRDQLDELKAVARRPLDEWEAEESEKAAAIQANLDLVKRISEPFDTDGKQLPVEDMRLALDRLKALEPSVDMGESLSVFEVYKTAGLASLPGRIEAEEKRLAEAAELERLRAEETARKEAELLQEMQRKAAEEATLKAEEAARELSAKQERERVQAEVRAEEAERKQAEAEKAAELEKQKSEERARMAAEAAKQAEIDRRNQDEKEAREKAEKLEADRAHVGRVLAEIKVSILPFIPSNSAARALVMAIRKGEIPRLSIDYQEAPK